MDTPKTESQNHTKKKMSFGKKILIIVCIAFALPIMGAIFGGMASNWESSTPQGPTDQQAEITARTYVKLALKYPDEAEFPGIMEEGATVVKTNNQYKIESWVKAVNAFGVKEKKYYTIVLRHKGGEWADPLNWEAVSFDMR